MKIRRHSKRALSWFNEKTKNYRLAAALTIAILAALVLTGVSVSIYLFGDFYRYDLSRPGYEKERQEVTPAEPQVTYDTTSPVTADYIDSFLQELDTRASDLQSYGDFREEGTLSDRDLQITD